MKCIKIEGIFSSHSLVEFYWEKRIKKGWDVELWVQAYKYEKRVEKNESTKKITIKNQ